LGITADTVKTHLSKALAKLGAPDRAHGVALLMRRGALR
jgi:DNA-binding CsgD family transcriptional regulator